MLWNSWRWALGSACAAQWSTAGGMNVRCWPVSLYSNNGVASAGTGASIAQAPWHAHGTPAPVRFGDLAIVPRSDQVLPTTLNKSCHTRVRNLGFTSMAWAGHHCAAVHAAAAIAGSLLFALQDANRY